MRKLLEFVLREFTLVAALFITAMIAFGLGFLIAWFDFGWGNQWN